MDDNKRLLLFIKDLLNDPDYAKKILDKYFTRKATPPPTIAPPQEQSGYENIRDTAYKTTTFKSLGDIVITNTELEQAKQTVKAENAVKYGNAPAKVTTVQTPPTEQQVIAAITLVRERTKGKRLDTAELNSLISTKDIPHPALYREIGLWYRSNGCPTASLVRIFFEQLKKKQQNPPIPKPR